MFFGRAIPNTYATLLLASVLCHPLPPCLPSSPPAAPLTGPPLARRRVWTSWSRRRLPVYCPWPQLHIGTHCSRSAMTCSWRTWWSRHCGPVAPGASVGCCRERCRPRPSHTEVRPDVLRDVFGELLSHVMYKGLIELSCVSSFAATVASTKSANGAWRPCADYWALNSPAVRHAY